ncbi:MAG: hypothetical protein IJQ73_02435 [Kiritimatiellae bacterium]|nr:hypothetical protein [Kiritimatiellia bacterium]
MNDDLMSFEEAVSQYLLEDPRYPAEAYYFIRDGFEYVARDLEEKEGAPRHLSGRELADGLKEFALDEYGPMAFFTLGQWNIHRTADFGELVYNLIRMGRFSQNKGDKKSDFNDLYDFDEVFNGPFRP